MANEGRRRQKYAAFVYVDWLKQVQTPFTIQCWREDFYRRLMMMAVEVCVCVYVVMLG